MGLMDFAEHLHRAVAHVKRALGNPHRSIVVDAGGADGGVSLFFARAFPGVPVFCVEPSPENRPAIARRIMEAPTISHLELALDERPGEATLYLTKDRLASSLNPVSAAHVARAPTSTREALRVERETVVRASTLDLEFADRQVALLKLDTQGTELRILRGGVATLTRTRFVLTEMSAHRHYEDGCQYFEVDEFLRKHGFLLREIVVTYRTREGLSEYDALYENPAASE